MAENRLKKYKLREGPLKTALFEFPGHSREIRLNSREFPIPGNEKNAGNLASITLNRFGVSFLTIVIILLTKNYHTSFGVTVLIIVIIVKYCLKTILILFVLGD